MNPDASEAIHRMIARQNIPFLPFFFPILRVMDIDGKGGVTLLCFAHSAAPPNKGCMYKHYKESLYILLVLYEIRGHIECSKRR